MPILNAGDPPVKLFNVQGGIQIELPHFKFDQSCHVQVRLGSTGNFEVNVEPINSIGSGLFSIGKQQTSGDFDVVYDVRMSGVQDETFSIVITDLNNPGSSPAYALLLARN